MVEWHKLRRSSTVRATTMLMVLMLPGLAIGFLVLARGGGPGAAALKAQALVPGEGWQGYLGAAGQVLAVGMFLGPGFVAAWVFGREFADRTFSSLFALPVSRSAIAAAKLVVLTGWGLVVALLTVSITALAGLLAQVGPTAGADVGSGLLRLAASAILSAIVATCVGLAASVGRGYLPGVGAVILLVAAAQIAVLLGSGGWFPVASPGLLAMAGSPGVPPVSATQILLVPLTALLAGSLTVRWWARAEV
ncbi:MAG: ABC transporter permease [Nocardioides sp.]